MNHSVHLLHSYQYDKTQWTLDGIDIIESLVEDAFKISGVLEYSYIHCKVSSYLQTWGTHSLIFYHAEESFVSPHSHIVSLFNI